MCASRGRKGACCSGAFEKSRREPNQRENKTHNDANGLAMLGRGPGPVLVLGLGLGLVPQAPAMPPVPRVMLERAVVLPAQGTAQGHTGHQAPVSQLIAGEN